MPRCRAALVMRWPGTVSAWRDSETCPGLLPGPEGGLMARRAGRAADVDDRRDHQDQDDASDRLDHPPDRHDADSALAERADHHEGSYHWQCWVLRAILVAVLV